MKASPFHIVFIVFVTILTFLCCGIVSGWSSLLLVLEKEKIYYEYCPSETTDDTCEEQVTQLNLIFTSGVVFSSLTSLPSGILLDRYGPQKPLHFGSVIFACACILFGLSANYDFDGFIPAFILFGIGPPTIFISLLGVANFIPKYMSTILSFLNCSFDASAFVFYLFKVVYDNTSLQIGTIFLGYSAISILVTASAVLWPKAPTKEDPLIEESAPSVELSELDENQDSTDLPSIEELPLLQKVQTFEFVFMLVYSSVNQLWSNTYIGTLEAQLNSIYSESEVKSMMNIFALILPFGFLGSPLIGYLLDNKGIKTSFSALGAGLVTFSLLNCFKSVYVLQILNFVVFTFVRAFFYGAIISFYFKVFGYKSFGRLFGIAQLVAGVVNFLQWTLLSMTYNFFNGNFLAMNIIQLLSVFLLSFFPLYLKLVEKNRHHVYINPI